MLIYSKSELNGKHMWDYEGNSTPKDDGVYPIISTSKELHVGSVIVVEGKAYVISSISMKGWGVAEEVEFQGVYAFGEEPKEQNYTSNIKCPYCGYEDEDSFENPDEDERCVCGMCGSVFSYQRIVTVEYCSQPVEKNDPVVLL